MNETIKNPVMNIEEISSFESHEHGVFKSQYAIIGEKIGAEKLGYSLSVVEPGHKVCPFHNHHVNEELFLILEGTGNLRFGDKIYPIKKMDIISCPPGGREVAHQIINTGETILKYLSLSTNESHEICEYPDSNKMMAMAGEQGKRSLRFMTKMEHNVPYFDGEK